MGTVVLNGATSGGTTIAPADAVTVSLTLPGASGTLLTTAGNLANATGLPLTTGVSGTLPVANGGTGQTSLASVSVGSATSATTATNLASGSNGTIPYQSASGTTQMLAVGTSGQVLQTNGAGAPSWVTPSAGALVKISTITASGSNIAFTGLSGYNNYVLVFDGVASSNPGYQLEMQIGVGSTTYLTSNYNNISKSGYGNPNNGVLTNNDSYYVNRDKFYITQDQTDATVGASGYINLFNFTNGKNMSYNSNMQYQQGSGSGYLGFAYGWGYFQSNTTTKTAILILPEGGSLSDGRITLYGVST